MVSNHTRELVAQRAKQLCEYCHSPEFVNTDRFTIDHIWPQSLAGSDELYNLALACRRCNERRYNFTMGIDPQTQEEVPLFNPRQQQWSEHFAWRADGIKIIGITSTGRATCNRLDMNDEYHANGFIQTSRRFWTRMGVHPPQEDRRLENEQ
ncbi:MAG: HNH endonuclease [Symploca sp. SIO1B1]|nr:HNH endonuclease [Symploca sp. SIO1B1]